MGLDDTPESLLVLLMFLGHHAVDERRLLYIVNIPLRDVLYLVSTICEAKVDILFLISFCQLFPNEPRADLLEFEKVVQVLIIGKHGVAQLKQVLGLLDEEVRVRSEVLF